MRSAPDVAKTSELEYIFFLLDVPRDTIRSSDSPQLRRPTTLVDLSCLPPFSCTHNAPPPLLVPLCAMAEPRPVVELDVVNNIRIAHEQLKQDVLRAVYTQIGDRQRLDEPRDRAMRLLGTVEPVRPAYQCMTFFLTRLFSANS